MTTPRETLKALRVEADRVMRLPFATEECPRCYGKQRYDAEVDENVCEDCLMGQIESLSDFIRDPGPKPLDLSTEEGECPNGTFMEGPRGWDCVCQSCQADRAADQADRIHDEAKERDL